MNGNKSFWIVCCVIGFGLGWLLHLDGRHHADCEQEFAQESVRGSIAFQADPVPYPTVLSETVEAGVPIAQPENWENVALDSHVLVGKWEGLQHLPLPEVVIGKPDQGRKFKALPPDVNIKFRIPRPPGIYEGGCDVYVSGKAFCTIHDPAEPLTRKVGKRVEGIVVAERSVHSHEVVRLNIPNGVVVELVRRSPKDRRPQAR